MIPAGTMRCSILIALIPAVAVLLPRPAMGQNLIEPTIHWAYASYLGTGWYKINDERSGFIFRGDRRRTFGEAGFDDTGKRELAYTLRVPLTLGVARLDFDDIPGFLDPDNLTTASANVGLDVDIPLTRRISVRPAAEVGYGTVLGESESALTYHAAFKAKAAFQSGRLEWAPVLGLGIAGYDPNEGASDDFSYAATGLEFGLPLPRRSLQGDTMKIYWHVSYVDFLDAIELQSGLAEIDSVANYWQFGLAIGKANEPLRFWKLNLDRLGLAYNVSPSGELRGIKLVVRSLYEL